MAHNCEHAHGSPAAKADWLTNTTAGVQAITSFISMLFYVARSIDSAANLDASFAGMSYPGLSAGIVLAIIGTVGSTYAHQTLNRLHQADAETAHDEHAHTTIDIEHRTQPLLEDAAETAHDEHAHTAIDAEPNAQPILQDATKTRKNAALTKLQFLALAGDILQHTAETAAPLAFIIALAIHLSRWEKIVANAACLLVGAVGSAASVRTCYRAIGKANASESHEETHGHSHDDESGSEQSLCSHHSHS
jgi:hypothetical protein